MSKRELLSRYVCADLTVVGADASSRKTLIQQMAALLATALPDDPENDVQKLVYHGLLEREKLGNTGVGNGVALPHCRIDITDKPIIAIITLDQAIDYDSADRQAVSIAVGLLVPQQASEEHLRILASIAEFLSTPENRTAIKGATSAEHVIASIANWRNAQDV